jgi:iron complex transport system permease protein
MQALRALINISTLATTSLIVATTLIALLLISIAYSLSNGAIDIPHQQVWLSLLDLLFNTRFSSLAEHHVLIIQELRLPRILLALLVGCLLAQSGAVMQGLFRNPLAEPGIIGVSAGAALGAIIAIVWLSPTFGSWTIPFGAFSAGLITTLLVYQLARSAQGTAVFMLLLAGIAVTAFASACIGFITYFTDDQKLRELSLWQMGSLAGADYQDLSVLACITGVLMLAFQYSAKALNALLLGEAEARHMGIDVEKIKRRLIVLCAISVGIAVAYAGIIAFVGLVVPHMIRLVCGPCHYRLLPLSALCGATLLIMADSFARTLVQPAEMPVGLVTALMGSPFFILLLLQQRKHWS